MDPWPSNANEDSREIDGDAPRMARNRPKSRPKAGRQKLQKRCFWRKRSLDKMSKLMDNDKGNLPSSLVRKDTRLGGESKSDNTQNSRGNNYAWSLPVGVHYNLGVNVNEALVDDLWVHAWVQHVGPPNVVDLSEGAHVVSYLNGHRLFDPYTVFYTAPNHALSEEKTHCGEVVPWRIKFHGNILVVKHDYDMVPMSITTEERGRVRDVVFACLQDHLLQG
ncbi:hypothetical protein DFH06DRAFT_1126902 [Mycena polygramma]|nr:hypothetical protein DFH06DRAFT_1140200 [Mycena polygramma]KAJ7666853.1 hypothetical protein DFH06DRAFT_1126902 [Mycena polygramma]